MAEFYNSPTDIRYTAAVGTWLAVAGTLDGTGVVAGTDGRKIVPAGTSVKPKTSGKTIVGDYDAAIITLDETAPAAGDATHEDAECLTVHEYDVTDGPVTATFFVYAVVNEDLITIDAAAKTALEAKGFRFRSNG